MNIKNQLPYLGTEQDDRSLKINEHITIKKNDWDRPDYDDFKSKVCQSEFECANVLTGISNIDSVKLIVDGLNQKLEIKEKPYLRSMIESPKWLAYFDFYCCMTDIRETIDLGVKTGELKAIDINENDGESISDYGPNFYFNPYIYYDVLQFLNWMKKNSFPIPDELQLYERDDGALVRLEGVQGDPSKSTPIRVQKILHRLTLKRQKRI